MNQPQNPGTSANGMDRRGFLKGVAGVAAVGALAGIKVPAVYAAEDNTIRVALVGCGGRGGGAAVNALSTPHGPVQLVAMADVFPDKLKSCYDGLVGEYGKSMDVPDDRKFVGFDAYRNAMDCLRPGDVVILTTPPAFRGVHFRHAIDKRLNVFMEKPVTVDGPTTKKMFALGEESVAKNLKVGVGLMCRHCDARAELLKRLNDGMAGDLITFRAYRVHAPVAECFVPANPGKISDVLYQIKNFHSFLWASGGLFSDFYIHNIDECCWMKGGFPVKAQALGGRHYRGDMVDQNFDVYDVEYTFGDGAKLFFQGRCMDGCENQFASYVHGSKGIVQISQGGHTPAQCRIWQGQDMSKSPVWKFRGKEPNPYQLEWNDLIDAIRKDKPYNEVKRGAEASLITSMGRMAAHTGQAITRDQMLDCPHEFAPQVATLTDNGPAPLLADASGKYPIPEPGIKRDREY